MGRASQIIGIAIALLASCGCAQSHTRSISAVFPPELSGPIANRDVEASVAPPRGWKPQPLKLTRTSKHEVWLSPTGRTAYGVIRFTLPIPTGYDLALWGFMREMKRTEGEATLVEKHWDENLPGVRFVAVGAFHRIEANFFVDGWTGWAVYAGTAQNQPVSEDELNLARLAREHTTVGLRDGNRR